MVDTGPEPAGNFEGGALAERLFRLAGIAAPLAVHLPGVTPKLAAFVASARIRERPWGLYRQLRTRGPVIRTRFGAWLVSGHTEATAVLRQTGTSVDEGRLPGYTRPEEPGPFGDLVDRMMLFRDPPDHARLRRLVARAFTPARIAEMRPRIDAIVDNAVRAFARTGSGDLMAELAYPLPVEVIVDMLGLPADDAAPFHRWARALASRLDLSPVRDETREARGQVAAGEIAAYLSDAVNDPRRRTPDGLLSALVAAEEEGDRLTHDEVIATAALLLIAGFETTANLLGNAVRVLLEHPDELRRLRAGEVSTAQAVEELLRFDGSVQLTMRIAIDPIELPAATIPAGEIAIVLLGAANRDPAVFDAPDDLRLDRTPNPHLAFSTGIHACLGTALARAEAESALPALLSALPDMALAGRPRMRDTLVLRGHDALPLRWSI